MPDAPAPPVDADPAAAAAVDPAERDRLRWERAALAGRLRSVEEERDAAQRRCERLAADRDAARESTRRLRASRSYRLGRALATMARDPLRAGPRLARGALRRLRRDRAADAPAPPSRRTPRVRLPVHLYLAVGLGADGLRDLVATLHQRLLVAADHRAVVLTDDPSFSLLRRYGVLLEYLPDQRTWARHRPDEDWDEVLTGRLALLYRDHGCERTVVVDRRTPPTLADLLR